ncbi:hypothetical protein [Methanobacterium sp. ACI-7]|uniref:hypothetical protein n=1 Tax=unclassified Methanobacterium TaxID=2627676 RepID=UPI0039C31B7E
MDNKGLIFTLDAAIALIPIFIIIAAVVSVSSSDNTYTQIRLAHNAQDTLENMGMHQNNQQLSTLQKITYTLSLNNNSNDGINEAGKIAGFYLNKTLGNSKYKLVEISVLNKTIVSNGDILETENISVGFKSFENYIFKLYIWN